MRLSYYVIYTFLKIYGGQSSHLPLKINTAGVIPVIFASSIWTNNIPIASSIEFKGHKITKDYIIEREIQHPLDIQLDSSLADQDKDRLLNLGIFADVSWSMVPLADLTVILQYSLIESSLRILPAASPAYEEEYGWSFGGMLMIRNFRGKNENLTFAGSTGARKSFFFHLIIHG